MIFSRLDQSGRILLTYFIVGFMLLGTVGVALKVKFGKPKTQAQMEEDFTPEQKAVLAAWRNVTAEMNKARADLEQSKREFVQLINEARQVAITKGLDPNVNTTWLDLQGNGQPIVTAPNAQGQQVSIHWGFRDDGLITWKRP